MSPEAQRIAIAEACGWRILAMTEAVKLGIYKLAPSQNPHAWQLLYDPANKVRAGTNMRDLKRGNWTCWIPAYLSDLNAMHEAEKGLDDCDWDRYLMNLATVVEARRCWKCSEAEPRSFAHATATQRAEAFLRCTGKWTDSPPEQRSEPEGTDFATAYEMCIEVARTPTPPKTQGDKAP